MPTLVMNNHENVFTTKPNVLYYWRFFLTLFWISKWQERYCAVQVEIRRRISWTQCQKIGKMTLCRYYITIYHYDITFCLMKHEGDVLYRQRKRKREPKCSVVYFLCRWNTAQISINQTVGHANGKGQVLLFISNHYIVLIQNIWMLRRNGNLWRINMINILYILVVKSGKIYSSMIINTV